MGIVPSVVLSGLAAVRNDTHRVLRVLDGDLILPTLATECFYRIPRTQRAN
jgi:hypothetical protein